MSLIDKAVRFDSRSRKQDQAYLYVVDNNTRTRALDGYIYRAKGLLKAGAVILTAAVILLCSSFFTGNKTAQYFPRVFPLEDIFPDGVTQGHALHLKADSDQPAASDVREPLPAERLADDGKNTVRDETNISKDDTKQISAAKKAESSINAPESGTENYMPVHSSSIGKDIADQHTKIRYEQKTQGEKTLHPALLINTGVMYFDQHDYKTARTFFKNALQIDPDNVKALNNLGLSYYREGDYDRAIQQFRMAIEINPDNVETYANMGIVYRKMKKYDQSEKMFLNALRRRPDHPEVIYNYALLCRDRGYTIQYHRLLDKFAAIAPAELANLKTKVREYLDSRTAPLAR